MMICACPEYIVTIYAIVKGFIQLDPRVKHGVKVCFVPTLVPTLVPSLVPTVPVMSCILPGPPCVNDMYESMRCDVMFDIENILITVNTGCHYNTK